MNGKALISIIILITLSFFIGLNIGLHGYVIIFHPLFNNNPTYTYTNSNIHVLNNTNAVIDSISNHNSTVSVNFLNSNKDISTNVPVTTLANNIKTDVLHSKLANIDFLVNNYIKEHIDTLNNGNSNNINTDIPIVLLTCNRPELLRNTLKSLLKVRGINKDNIIISQDGALKEIVEIVKEFKLTLIQNLQGIRLRGGAANDGASRIAQHYKFSLTSTFDRKPNAKSLIIIEDDLLFSPDFYEYLQVVSPILNKDPTSFIVSAWSDNGFISHVKDPYSLRRTNYFPGLGWLLTRELYKNELEASWPKSHWDHWLRSPEISKNRAIIYPQIPRTYHNGIKGTFMDLNTHNKYFRDIGYNIDSNIIWNQYIKKQLIDINQYPSDVIYLQAHKIVYDYRIMQVTKICKHVNSVMDLIKYENEVLCVWIEIDTDCDRKPVAFEPIAQFFQLWHEHRRGNYEGIHEFYWETNYILLTNIFNPYLSNNHHNNNGFIEDNQIINSMKSTYRHLMPTNIEAIKQSNRFDKSLLLELKRRKLHIQPIKATKVKLSCDDVCKGINKSCDLNSLQLLNNCDVMQQNFPCKECHSSEGSEQPAYVDIHADIEYLPGHCLINSNNPSYTTCDSSHLATIRLCSCL